MSGDGFLRFLLSDENAPVFLDRTELYQEMDHPFCHYYISSSHNTYLTGRQYGGKSSTEIYRQVLLAGCRCIELDCWDGTGENKGEPIITHGKAMCTDVFFRDVLYQIRETAFARNDFPVILSFENHCCKSNQLKMAKYCMDILGDLLLSKPLDDHPLDAGVPLPSPNRLKRKILIKNKRLKSDVEKHQLEQFLREGKLDEDEDTNETPEVVNDYALAPPANNASNDEVPATEQDVVAAAKELDHLLVRPQSSTSVDGGAAATTFTRTTATTASAGKSSANHTAHPPTNAGVDGKEHDEAHPELKTNFISKLKPLGFTKKSQPILTKEEEERIFAEYNYTGATTNIHPLLSSLVNYTHPVKFSGFDIAESNDFHFHMSSFSESTGLGYLKQSAPEFVNYNKRQLSRIYPKGARVDSSNFLPQIFWNAGCQMVALNFQTSDIWMQLNQGKFDYNGGCGYLLKPDFMRRPDRSFDPFSESPVDGVIAAHCSVRIISGHFLCDRNVGTYVEVEMYGLPTDTIRKEHRTRTVPANGLNPIYNDDPFVFRKVVLPELAVLRFAVYDENGKQLGQRILPLDGLQAGYRHISLRTDSNMAMTLPTLFVHLVLKTYVPDELSGLVDALADPRAYLSAQEKRKEALHLMGVDDSDIVEVAPANGGPNMSGGIMASGGPSRQANVTFPRQSKQNGILDGRSVSGQPAGMRDSQKQSNENLLLVNSENKFKIDNIVIGDLRKDKTFQKLLKKHQKDMDEVQKRQQKQRDVIQKQQQTNVDKLLVDHHKSSTKKRGGISVNFSSGSTSSRHSSLSERSSNPVSADSMINTTITSSGVSMMTTSAESSNDKRIRDLVLNQTDEWSKLVRNHELENFELRKKQIQEECDLLKKLLSEAQKQQIVTMKQKYDAENKEVKQAQTKKSMDDTKAIQQDKSIKTKAERDRRVKELNEKNVKVFVEERKRLATRWRRNEEQVEIRHNEQLETLEKEIGKAIDQEEMNHREALLASRPESIV